MSPLQIIGTVSLAIGCVFALTGSVGVLRMPDFYARLHPAGKSDTLAQAMILLGLVFFSGDTLVDALGAEHGDHGSGWLGPANTMLKLLLLALLLFLTAPTATHAIAKAARLDIHTEIPVESDPGTSRVAEIIVPGDLGEKLEEPPAQTLDVHEPDPPPEAPAAPTEANPSENGENGEDRNDSSDEEAPA